MGKKKITMAALVILLAMVQILLDVPAAAYSKSSEDVLEAYAELLSREYGEDKFFAVADLNADGISELLVKDESRFCNNEAYSYKDGKVCSIKWEDAPNINSGVYLMALSGTFAFFAGGWKDSDTFVRCYIEYQFTDDRIQAVNDISVDEQESVRDNYTLNGESFTEKEYEKIKSRIESGEPVKYSRNTEEERRVLTSKSNTSSNKGSVKGRTAGLSKSKLKKLEQSLFNLQTMTNFNYKTDDYGSMIGYVVNVENPWIAESVPFDAGDSYNGCMKIKKKPIDVYLKKKFHLKKPKKKILITAEGSGHIYVKEVKGYYYVMGATGEAGRTAKIISVKKRKDGKYEVMYDKFIENDAMPIIEEVYEETMKAIMSYSSELKTWTFYKVTSKGKLSGHPKKNYLNTGFVP